ncbi:MAG: bifunctional diaminohydroxyphosphoribosylaminopyrimidine deaminase/5-amino-6-(5-phosphoribosylamino)uracil reductase RibD [Candidatus Dormibacteraeota bacterium]|uniref:Riboflavin biosynthesis protein RibD n=2 Tax=Candidatus Nephthysia bennettiae TaxID=3127016 RepID=A0A934K6A4_9BACT|nr:bifunctional diaminohydroxyphosphoribosylaminopyrimidine deaminase/5-amino-6-(5-phosphoribosylamino)uracil reductase RibD [Candidatus Dormibacteraeota bacterium]MBJ7611767.1 bifunctional diaminohydroxyphosphoribosylaminopyrimidine deaminase/5-amino-6-(5-phosphoribosylamino)uracil reductase RibD [Candidatus Dormibacteraeota bacterium]
MPAEAEIVAMRWANHLAQQALGSTSPNPPVGCVIMDVESRIVGEGFTSPPGGPHAEVNALRAAGLRARGGTAVVTLEPCNHHGRTPPCTEALIAARVARVVYALRDPHSVAAGGAAALRAAGVDVEGGVLPEEASRVSESWLTYVTRRRPFVTLVYGASLDGRVAARDWSGRWSNSQEALLDVRSRLRAENDAVMVGCGTVRMEDPNLAAVGDVRRQPLTVLLDTEARTPAAAHAFDGPGPALVAVAEDVDAGHLAGRAEVLKVPRAARGLDLTAVLKLLHDRGVCAVMVEGGPTLSGSFVSADLVDKVVAYFAPMLIGGGGHSAVAGPGAASIDAAWRFRLDEVTRIGTDSRMVARHPGRLEGLLET